MINNLYVKILGLDMSEFSSASSYDSLNALFTREMIRPREIDKSLDSYISPTDSYITECGGLDGDTLLQIKGMSYSAKELLTEYVDNYDRVVDGDYINFYLSPKDYHRYHSPYFLHIKKLIHVPGKLYPVNIPYLNKQPSLFVENERVILEAIDENDNVVYLIFVGALNVGQMVFEFEPSVETNSDTRDIKVYEYDDLHVNKGDCLGYFKMGSTVVMISQKDYLNLQVEANNSIKFTDIIATLKK
jgi:phosphatidylserine decarboxylase